MSNTDINNIVVDRGDKAGDNFHITIWHKTFLPSFSNKASNREKAIKKLLKDTFGRSTLMTMSHGYGYRHINDETLVTLPIRYLPDAETLKLRHASKEL